MSRFYVLPPRPMLGESLAGILREYLPGLDWDGRARVDLAEELVLSAICSHPEVYVVFRDDMPAGEGVAEAMAEGFGAEAGDEIVEVRPSGAGPMTTRRWRLGRAA